MNLAAADPVGSSRPQECSSMARAPVSKTGGCRFESCHSCQLVPNCLILLGCDTVRLLGATIFVLCPVRHKQAHRLASHPFAVGRVSISLGLCRGVPIEDSHELIHGGTILRRERRPGLSKPM